MLQGTQSELGSLGVQRMMKQDKKRSKSVKYFNMVKGSHQRFV